MSEGSAAIPGQPTWSEFWAQKFAAGGHPLTQLLSQRVGACLAYASYRLGLSPSALTLAGAVVGLGTSLAYALAPPGVGTTLFLIVAYQLAYGFDCADGQLARASRRASEFGAWFDVTVDFVRYLAIGYAILVLLLQQHGLGLAAAVPISGIFMVGTVVSLHTSISLQRLAARQPAQPQAAPSPSRRVLRTIIDTPVLLLMLCVLRDFALLLSFYVIAMGGAYLLVAVMLARRRFQRAA